MSEIAKKEQSRCAKGFESGVNSKKIELSSLYMVRVAKGLVGTGLSLVA